MLRYPTKKSTQKENDYYARVMLNHKEFWNSHIAINSFEAIANDTDFTD